MYSTRKALVDKGALPRPVSPRFQQATVVDSSANTQWQIQLPNGAVVGFTGKVGAATLESVLRTVAALS